MYTFCFMYFAECSILFKLMLQDFIDFICENAHEIKTAIGNNNEISEDKVV